MSTNINPSARWCWNTCGACYRCGDKGRYSQCSGCSGRHDPFNRVDVDPDDTCQCTLGILHWKTKDGRLLISKYKNDPFKAKIQSAPVTKDEQDYDAYLKDLREKLDSPRFDPISFT